MIRRHPKQTAAFVVSIAALVLSMAGGAFASGHDDAPADKALVRSMAPSLTVKKAGNGYLAYAHVRQDGTVDAGHSKGITGSNVSKQSTSAYCFHNLSFTFKNVSVTADYGDPTNGGHADITTSVALGDPWADCSSQAGTVLEVATQLGA